MKTLYPRQEQHVDRLLSVLSTYGSVLDSSETGTGKTVCGAEIASRANGNVIVVCPKAVIPSWQRELADRGVKADVINYEKLRTGKTKFGKWQNRKWVWTIPESLLIFDEAHKCSGVGTQNAKMLIEAKDRHAVLMLSATIASSPTQMRAAGWLLGAHMLGNFWQWCLKNGCSKNRWNGVDFMGDPKHIANIASQIAHRCARMTTAELADHFAETQIITEPLQFGDEIAKIYDEMEVELLELEKASKADKKNSAAEALVAQLRARQRVELLKVPVIVEMVDDLLAEGKSVAVFVNFQQTLDALQEKIPGQVEEIDGRQNAKRREDAIARFQHDESRVIVCNTAAGGVGISLHDVTGKHPRAAIISPDWNEKNIIQVVGRVHRAGGKTPSMQRILFAAGTVEEKVEKSVRKKIKNLNLLNKKSTCPSSGEV
jgi:superfamily II DNA or RNA helicase